jgi:hypothetical protein
MVMVMVMVIVVRGKGDLPSIFIDYYIFLDFSLAANSGAATSNLV